MPIDTDPSTEAVIVDCAAAGARHYMRDVDAWQAVADAAADPAERVKALRQADALRAAARNALIAAGHDPDNPPPVTTRRPLTADELAQREKDRELGAQLDAAERRRMRDAALAASDWTQLPDARAAMTPAAAKAWATYRQALRDHDWRDPGLEIPTPPGS